MDFLLSAPVAPFSAALVALIAIGLIEGLSLLVTGVAGLTHAVGSALDTDLDFPNAPVGLDWLVVRGMPLTVTLSAALGGFSIAGLSAQYFASSGGSAPMSLPAALAVGTVGALGSIRIFSAVFKRLKLSENTEAIGLDSLIGRSGTMQEPAVAGRPALAHVRDQHGTLHLVMVEPQKDAELSPGQTIELISRQDGSFRGRSIPKP